MREFKFRVFFYDGEDYETGEMLSFEEAIKEDYIVFHDRLIKPFDICSILMQYTGLKDKNGVEVYESDIVKAHHKWRDETWIGHIVFQHACFEIAGKLKKLNNGHYAPFRYWKDGVFDWHSMEQFDGNDLEVLGNIYQNSEILKNDRS